MENNENTISVERVFNLGEYKSLRVQVYPTELSDEDKNRIMFENACDVYAQLFWHQLVNAELNDLDVDYWTKRLEAIKEIKAKYMHKIMEE